MPKGWEFLFYVHISTLEVIVKLILEKYLTKGFNLDLTEDKLTISCGTIKGDNCIFYFENNKSSDYLEIVKFLSSVEIEVKIDVLDGNLTFIEIGTADASYPIPNVNIT